MDTPTTNPLKDFMINHFYPTFERLYPKYAGITERAKTDPITNALYEQALYEIRCDCARIGNSDN